VLDRHLYKGYLLSCSPTQRGEGLFQARLSITALASDKTRAQRFFDLECFASESEAAAHAKAVGMKWVDDNADAVSATTALSGGMSLGSSEGRRER
jgi:hypothetical protein